MRRPTDRVSTTIRRMPEKRDHVLDIQSPRMTYEPISELVGRFEVEPLDVRIGRVEPLGTRFGRNNHRHAIVHVGDRRRG